MAESQYFMLPGPTQVPPRILRAGSAPMVNHRGPEFKKIITEMSEGLKLIFKTDNDVLTLTCSGSGGLEASVVNFINKGDKVIVASVGNFGERYKDLCEKYGALVDHIAYPWGDAIDPRDIKDRLDADTKQEIKAILFQHNETSTGVLNPVKEIAAIRGDHPALLIVDSVSGMAAAPLETDAWGLDVVVAGSQKAFMAPPGLAFVSVSERAWEVNARCTQPRYYLDLAKARKSLADGQTPYTPAVATIYSVAEAVMMMLETGLENIIAAHSFRRDVVRTAAKALGLTPVAQDKYASPAVTAIYAPEGIAAANIVKPMHSKYHTVIAGGQGIFKGKIFRIGHLGYVNDLDLVSTLAALEMALVEAGYPCQLGQGVAAAQKLIMAKHSS